MAIFTKDLATLVNKVLEKEEKIKTRISIINNQISQLQETVQEKTKELINYELSEDQNGQRKCLDEIKDLRSKVVEQQDLLAAYKHELNKAELPERELLKIKEAALKEVKVRSEKARDILEQKREAEEQLKVLENKVRTLGNEHSIITSNRVEITEVEKIIKYIEPLAAKIHLDGSRKGFISAWIEGGDTEQYLIMEKLKPLPQNF